MTDATFPSKELTVSEALHGAAALRPFASNFNERSLIVLADEIERLKLALEHQHLLSVREMDRAERLRTALRSYGHHVHPNCYDLRLNEDGTLGERNGCLCGFDAVKSANSGPKTSRPACSICDDTGSMSDGTACPHLAHETGPKP